MYILCIKLQLSKIACILHSFYVYLPMEIIFIWPLNSGLNMATMAGIHTSTQGIMKYKLIKYKKK